LSSSSQTPVGEFHCFKWTLKLLNAFSPFLGSGSSLYISFAIRNQEGSLNKKIEDIVTDEKRPKFKSEGERRIAYFLDKNSIKYLYEPGILVNSAGEKPRIWYPDFYLPEFGTYIEYYGLAGRQNYDRGLKTKQSVYSKMALDVISVYPWMFAENWQTYVMRELERSTLRRYKNLTAKFYRTQHPSTPYRYIRPSPGKYHGGSNRRY
jgi:hypothetical protein